MTGAERSWASHSEIDDVIRYTRGNKAIGIEAAAHASVVAINPAVNQLTVEKANQELATYMIPADSPASASIKRSNVTSL
jgi:hypothetical protein